MEKVKYLFTIDWCFGPQYQFNYAEMAAGHKCGHVFESDDGYLLCQPNNRIFWRDSNWVTKQIPEDLKQFKVDSELISVENKSNKWITADTDSFYYDINKSE
jgi:hypothetical protein